MRRVVLALGASVALLGAGSVFALPQQGTKGAESPKTAAPAVPAPAKEAGEDHLGLPPVLDSWYRIQQGDNHVGYVHEILQRSRLPQARYEFTSVEEAEVEIPDPANPQKSQVVGYSVSKKGDLDDTFAPISLQMFFHIGALEANCTILADQEGRQMEIVSWDGTRKTAPVPSLDDLYYDGTLMLLAMRQSGRLSSPGLRKVRTFSPTDDGFSLTDISFEVAGDVDREYWGSKVKVTRIAWVVPPSSSNQKFAPSEVFVDRYGRPVEVLLQGAIRYVLVKDQDEAVGQSNYVRLGGRRDPFNKKMAMRAKSKKDDEKATGEAVQEVAVKDFVRAMTEVEQMLGALKKTHELGQEQEAEALYRKILAYLKKLRELAPKERPDQLTKIQAYRQEAEDAHHGIQKTMAQVQQRYVSAVKAFEDDDSSTLERNLDEMRKFEGRLELEGTPELGTVRKLANEVEVLVGRSKTRQELGRKRLDLSGTIICLEEKPQRLEAGFFAFGHRVGDDYAIRFIQGTEFAVINDRLYKRGDIVEGVRVEKIWTHGVQVSLRDETREVGIRQ